MSRLRHCAGLAPHVVERQANVGLAVLTLLAAVVPFAGGAVASAQGPPAVVASGVEQNRYLSMSVPTGPPTAIRVTVDKVYHRCSPESDVPYAPCTTDEDCPKDFGQTTGDCATPFADFEAQPVASRRRYVNGIKTCVGGTEPGGFTCTSQAECDAREFGGSCNPIHICKGDLEHGPPIDWVICPDQAFCDERRSCQGGNASGFTGCSDDRPCHEAVCLPRGGTCLPTLSCNESPNFLTLFECGVLGPEPEYRSWAADLDGQVLHVTGVEVVPARSLYLVEQLDASCEGAEEECAAPLVSPWVGLSTTRWGDVVPGGLEVLDVAEVVDHVKGVFGSFIKPRVHLRPNLPAAFNENVSVLDIAETVDAVKGKPYPGNVDP